IGEDLVDRLGQAVGTGRLRRDMASGPDGASPGRRQHNGGDGCRQPHAGPPLLRGFVGVHRGPSTHVSSIWLEPARLGPQVSYTMGNERCRRGATRGRVVWDLIVSIAAGGDCLADLITGRSRWLGARRRIGDDL